MGTGHHLLSPNPIPSFPALFRKDTTYSWNTDFRCNLRGPGNTPKIAITRCGNTKTQLSCKYTTPLVEFNRLCVKTTQRSVALAPPWTPKGGPEAPEGVLQGRARWTQGRPGHPRRAKEGQGTPPPSPQGGQRGGQGRQKHPKVTQQRPKDAARRVQKKTKRHQNTTWMEKLNEKSSFC